MTTLGSAAMISTVGLILERNDGSVNCDVYSAASTPSGTANSIAYSVPFIVPNTSGTRLNFGSMSSVAPVDCQTYSGSRIPLVPNLAEQGLPADFRMRVQEVEATEAAGLRA